MNDGKLVLNFIIPAGKWGKTIVESPILLASGNRLSHNVPLSWATVINSFWNRTQIRVLQLIGNREISNNQNCYQVSRRKNQNSIPSNQKLDVDFIPLNFSLFNLSILQVHNLNCSIARSFSTWIDLILTRISS